MLWGLLRRADRLDILMSQSPLRAAWYEARRRCSDQKNPSYSFYGGIGITFCEDWLNFNNFFEWAESSGYEAGKCLLRKNKTKGYNSLNCFWGEKKEISTQNTHKKKKAKQAGKKYRGIHAEKERLRKATWYEKNKKRINKKHALYNKTEKEKNRRKKWYQKKKKSVVPIAQN